MTADNESPLVNTLYCDIRLSHLNSTHIRIQHAFQEDDRKRLPLAVTCKLTKETRQILHSRRITKLGNQLQDLFPNGTLHKMFYRFQDVYNTHYPDHLRPLNHPFYDFLSPKQQKEWRDASDKVLNAIDNGLNHPTGVILPAYSINNLGQSINILCADYLGTNSDKLSSTFWDFIDDEYKTLCRQAQQANQDPYETPFPLTRMHQILDTLALPLNEYWRLQ